MITADTQPKAIGSDDRDLVAGQQVGEYVIEAKIGQGGFGTVFRAAHPLIGKIVAIKVLNRQYSSQPEMVSRFVAEARAVNQIRNRFIIDIFGFGQIEDGRHYYVMEHLDGIPLDDHLARNGRLLLEDAIPILRAVARALDAAHAKGIAHRDLKPENIFLASESDGTLYPKLLDFGIAKLLVADDHAKHKTRTGAPMGTPYYMSPEQCRGRDVDHRTDVYAFGCVTYKLLTGQVPFEGEDYMTILIAQMNDPVPSASARVAGLAPGIDEAIAWMMAKDPAERPTSLVAAVRALEDAATAAGLSVPPSIGSLSGTPSNLPSVSGGRASTPKVTPSGFADAATMDASALPPISSASIAPAPILPAPARQRTGLIVGLGAGLVGAIAVVVVMIVMKQPETVTTTSSMSSVAVEIDVPDPITPPVIPAKPDAIVKVTPPPTSVSVTLKGLPTGTEVRDAEGTVLTTATGGDTTLAVKPHDAPITLGLQHPTKGTGSITLAPSDTEKTAGKLTPHRATKKLPNTKPPAAGSNTANTGSNTAPGGDSSNATLRPDFGSKK